MIKRIKKFVQESRQEIKLVNWPTKKETIRYTFFVVGISAVIALFLGILDYVFLRILNLIV